MEEQIISIEERFLQSQEKFELANSNFNKAFNQAQEEYKKGTPDQKVLRSYEDVRVEYFKAQQDLESVKSKLHAKKFN